MADRPLVRWTRLIVLISFLHSTSKTAVVIAFQLHQKKSFCPSPSRLATWRRHRINIYPSSKVSSKPCNHSIRHYFSQGERRQRLFAPLPLQQAIGANGRSVELDNEEPLSVLFQRALILQRAGSIEEALENYSLFCKAAQQCQVEPAQYAEVHVNMGAIYIKKGSVDLAEDSFNEALKHRQIGTAYVNLAVLQLKKASSSISPQEGLHCLQTAKEHCQEAILLNDEPRSFGTATRLLADIDRMMNQAAQGGRN